MYNVLFLGFLGAAFVSSFVLFEYYKRKQLAQLYALLDELAPPPYNKTLLEQTINNRDRRGNVVYIESYRRNRS